MIDDCRSDAAITLRALRGAPHAKYEMAIAEKISTAIPLLRTEPSDVILLDLGMPGYVRLQALEEVLQADLDLPIVVFSGNNDESLAQDALKLGAQDYLIKDQVTPELISRSVRYAIERHAVDRLHFQAKQSRGEFLRRLSHEVRDSSYTIQGSAGELCTLTDPQQRTTAQAIQQNGAALVRVFDELLEIARLEISPISLSKDACSIREDFAAWAEKAITLAENRNVVLHVEIADSLPERAVVDLAQLKKLFDSFTRAAIGSCQTGLIRVEVSATEGRDSELVIDVTESGNSTWRTSQERNTPWFTTTSFELTKSLADVMGGSFVAFRDPNVVSAYSVTIPIDPKPATENCAVPAPANRPTNKPPVASKSNAKPAVNLAGFQVLVVEDAVDNQRLLKLVLQSVGAHVEIVENGQLAVDRLMCEGDFQNADTAAFDVVLMDMQMPVLDGYDATAKLRQRGYTGKIMAVTAHVLERERQKCFDAGCDDYLSKPVNPLLLREKVAACRQFVDA